MKAMNKTKLGISSYCYPFAVGIEGFEPFRRLTAFDLVDKAVELQVDVLQIADNYPLNKLSGSDLKSLSEYAKNNSITLEVGTRGIETDNLLKYIEIAEVLNSKLLRVVIDTVSHHPELDEILTLVNAVMPALQEKNVVLGIENHDRFKASVFAEIVERLNSPYVGIVLDTVNSFACEENTEQVMSCLAKHTVNYHIKDFEIERIKNMMGLLVTGTIAGKGRLNIPKGIERLSNEAKSDFSSILELWMAPEATIEATIEKEDCWVKESIAYLKQVLNDRGLQIKKGDRI